MKMINMPRPRRFRRIWNKPGITYFKPAGVPIRQLKENKISLVELEAIRLKDLLQLEQKECAQKMDISQPTFHRLLLDTRKKIADALVNGKSINLEDKKDYNFAK
jgi:predicted DNA-binding protein (UPF0251 family)